LYLAEQEKTAKMKIDEPKTPWAPSYNPALDEREDMEIEAEDRALDAHDLVVDELDQVNSARQKQATGPVHDNEIPDFELGEPEEDIHAQQNLATADGGSRITRERSLSQNSNRSDKHVDVVVDDEEGSGHGEGLMTTDEAKEKHRQFEERRKRHYEMRNIKDILAYVFPTSNL
jgi:protein phosphatase inhibitor 2